MMASKKLSIVTVAAVLSVAPLAALADVRVGQGSRTLPPTIWDGLSTGSIVPGEVPTPIVGGCRRSSAQEGNANQQNFPVQQYGQVSGGYRC